MNTKTLSVTNLGGSVCHYSAVSWSEDNRIAITMEKGIHILEPQCKPNNSDGSIHFQRHFLPAPTSCNQFDVEIGRDVLDEKLKSNKEAMYYLLLNPTLSPATASQQSFKGFRVARWSFKEASASGRCLLATLTMDHRLELYCYNVNQWQRLADLSAMFHVYIKNRNYTDCTLPSKPQTTLKEGEILFHQFNQRSYTLAAMDMVWTGVFLRDKKPSKPFDYPKTDMASDKFSMLIVAMKTGQLVLWKVLVTPTTSSAVEVLAVLDSEMGSITSLYWQQLNNRSGLLIVGGHEGKVRVFYVMILWMGRIGIVNLRVVTSLWIWNYADKLSVSQIACQKSRENSYYVITSRGSYVLACELEVKESTLTMKFQSFCVGCHTLPITGLCDSGGGFLIASEDGCLQHLQLEITKAGLQISHQKLPFDIPLTPCKKSLMGLAASPSRALICSLGKKMDHFDHFCIKEPIELTIFTLMSTKDTVSLLLRRNESFGETHDVLEHIRLFLAAGETFPTELSTLISMNDTEIALQNDYSLMLLRWWLKWMVTNQTLAEKKSEMEERVQRIEESLLKRRLMNWLRNNNDSAEDGDGTQLQSVQRACQWIQSRNDITAEERAFVNNIFANKNFDANKNSLVQTCQICEEDIPFDNLWFAPCPNRHVFQRCSMTLGICDQMFRRKCICCDSLALKTDKSNLHCVFCDSEMRDVDEN